MVQVDQEDLIESNKMVYLIDKSTLIEEAVNGAWDTGKRAKLQYYTNMDNALGQNFRNNTTSYFLNPFVSGPITHLGTKLSKIWHGLGYNILKHRDSDKVTGPTVTADAKKGSFNSEIDVQNASNSEYGDALARIRTNNPIQYAFNPLVPGNAQETLNNANIAKGGLTRSILSPTTKAGDTLIKKPQTYLR